MPVYKQGDMWSVFDEVDYFIVTTNSFVKQNGELVMGRGIAKQVRDKFPGIAAELGQAVKDHSEHLGHYGLVATGKIGAFQVKFHFKDRASLELIAENLYRFAKYAREHSDISFAMNFPGIGNGGLAPHWIKPLLDQLPDNVQVWSFK